MQASRLNLTFQCHCWYVCTGDDQKVNIWRLGKTQPLLNLCGHNTEVDSCIFDVDEKLVAAGSRGGSIKVWDLSEEKLIRTLTGHRSSVRCLDFHPYGDYFASGSADCNVKIFDVRKKQCMQTYRGHTSTIVSLKHSPDGHWVVSGDMEGVVKVWDLTTGKELNEFRLLKKGRENKEQEDKGQEGIIDCWDGALMYSVCICMVLEPVTSLDFHPNEFLLAVGGEHQIHFWDMENFQLLANTQREANPIRLEKCMCYHAIKFFPLLILSPSVLFSSLSLSLSSISFSRCGRALMSGSTDALRTWSWEPLENQGTGRNYRACRYAYSSFIYSQLTLSISLSLLCPVSVDWGSALSSAPALSAPQQLTDLVEVIPCRELIGVARCRSTMTIYVVDVSSLPPFDKPLPVELAQEHNINVQQESVMQQFQNMNPIQAQKDQQSYIRSSPPPSSSQPPISVIQPASKSSILATPNPNFFAAHHLVPHQAPDDQSSHHQIQVAIPNKPFPSSSISSSTQAAHKSFSETGHHVSIGTDMTQNFGAGQQLIPNSASSISPPSASPPSVFQSPGSHYSSSPPSSSLEEPLPALPALPALPTASPPAVAAPAAHTKPASSSSSTTSPDRDALVTRINSDHAHMMFIVKARAERTKQLAQIWGAANVNPTLKVKQVVEQLVKMQDQSVSVDFLTHAEQHVEPLLTLELAQMILPLIHKLLSSKFENYAHIGLKYLKHILFYFTPVIQSSRTASSSIGSGVDVVREERVQRANQCFELCKAIYPTVQPIAKRTNQLGEMARQARKQLEELLFGSNPSVQ